MYADFLKTLCCDRSNSCCYAGLLVLKELGIEVEKYIASEIDPDAIKVKCAMDVASYLAACLWYMTKLRETSRGVF